MLKVHADYQLEEREEGDIGHRVFFYAVIITPVKAKHFPTYWLVSATLE